MDSSRIGIGDKHGAWHSHASFDDFALGTGFNGHGIPVWGLGGKRKMSWKDYLYALLAGSVGVAVYLTAKFIYKRLKAGKWDWIFDEEEKRDLLEMAEKIVKEYEEERKK